MDGIEIGRVVVMLLFTSVNLILIWVNYIDLHSPAYEYGLVVGPPTETMLMALFVFNIIASVLSGVEIINALTIPFSEGKPRLPLELEQCLVLALESVPLAAINLSIVVCRMRNHTPLQISGCAFFVLNFLVRMVYARAFQQEFKSCSKGFKMCVLVCAGMFFILLLILCGLVWGRVNASFRPLPEASTSWLTGVSLMLLNAPNLEYQKLHQYDLTSIVRQQNIAFNKPWLVKNLWDIKQQEGDSGLVVVYPCQSMPREQLRPEECEGFEKLRFHFKYNHEWQWSPSKPLGIISYNYAQVSDKNAICLQANNTLAGDWKLFYFTIKLDARTNWTVAVLASSPWPEACTVPFPLYDPSIPVCW